MSLTFFALLSSCMSLAGLRPAAGRREQAFPAFMEWLHTNDVDTSAVEIHAFPGYGHGLKAVKDIKVNQPVALLPE